MPKTVCPAIGSLIPLSWKIDLNLLSHTRSSPIRNGKDPFGKDGILSSKKAGILESFVAKDWAIKLATEAAVAVLRVDSIIVSKQAGIAPPKQSGHWDDD
ncbi:MAG: hypothetical protein EOO38_15300 [Cytophagaceae bacterium]|nr:MAG: hypothetical protein EOO38_15300 [Cytophagaceae bacterium]